MEYINLGDYEQSTFKVITNPHDTISVVIMDQDGFANSDNHKHINNTGIYFLVNRDDQSIYIGESYDLIGRMKQHRNTRFTDIAILVSRQSADLSKGEVTYLERYYINYFKENSFNVVNGNDGHSKADNGIRGHQKHKLDAFKNEVSRLLEYSYIVDFLPLSGKEIALFDNNDVDKEKTSNTGKRRFSKLSFPTFTPPIITKSSGRARKNGTKTTQYLYETEHVDILLTVDSAKVSKKVVNGILIVLGKVTKHISKKEISKTP